MFKISDRDPVIIPGEITSSLKRSEIDSQTMKGCIFLNVLLGLLAMASFDKSREIHGIGFAVLSMILVASIVFARSKYKKLDTRDAILIVFALGFILRLNYVVHTTVNFSEIWRQHDVRSFKGDSGHAGYIMYFYENGLKLPDFDPTTRYQFYHPPLHHYIAGTWMRILTSFGFSPERAVGSIQFLTLFYSMGCLFISERIFSQLKLYGTGKILALSIVAFHPTFIILAGSVNNDVLSIMFILLTIYAAIKWYRETTIKNIILIAVSIGLGMMTKLSSALIAPPVAVLFLIKLITNKRNKEPLNIRRYFAFGGVCIPLGMWFYIRNLVKYDVSLNYVIRLEDDSPQYIGFRTVFERLFDLSNHSFKNPFLNEIVPDDPDTFFEYNPFVSIIKTSVFGEWRYDHINGALPWCKFLIIINIILIIISLAAMVWFTVKRNMYLDMPTKVFLVGYWGLIFVNFIKFSFDFPHTCSMDFRYIVPTLVIGAAFIGMLYGQIDPKRRKYRKILNYAKSALVAAVSLFCMSSAVIYISLGM